MTGPLDTELLRRPGGGEAASVRRNRLSRLCLSLAAPGDFERSPMNTLIERLDQHIAMMAPHQRERQAGKLLVDLRDCLNLAPVAIMDTRTALGLCAPTEADFPALYALQGHRVALVDLGPNV